MAQKVLKAKTPTKAHYASGRGLASRVELANQVQKHAPVAPYKVGDTVRVHVRIKEGEKERIQIFEGVVIRRGNHGAGKSYTVRKISHGVGVERIFLEASPKVAKVEVAQAGKVRRAKLYYLRGLVGKSARVEQDIQTNESQAASAAAKSKTSN